MKIARKRTNLPINPSKATTNGARSRVSATLFELERQARQVSERQYSEINISKELPSTIKEHKKRLRNKSAFISRQTQRHYEQMLEELLEQSERERNGALLTCIEVSHEIQALRFLAAEIAEIMSAQSALNVSNLTSIRTLPDEALASCYESDSIRSLRKPIINDKYQVSSRTMLCLSRAPEMTYPHGSWSADLPSTEQMSIILDEAIG